MVVVVDWRLMDLGEPRTSAIRQICAIHNLTILLFAQQTFTSVYCELGAAPRGCTSVRGKRDLEKVPGATGQSLAPRSPRLWHHQWLLLLPLLQRELPSANECPTPPAPPPPPAEDGSPRVQGGAERKARVQTAPVSTRVTFEGRGLGESITGEVLAY